MVHQRRWAKIGETVMTIDGFFIATSFVVITLPRDHAGLCHNELYSWSVFLSAVAFMIFLVSLAVAFAGQLLYAAPNGSLLRSWKNSFAAVAGLSCFIGLLFLLAAMMCMIQTRLGCSLVGGSGLATASAIIAFVTVGILFLIVTIALVLACISNWGKIQHLWHRIAAVVGIPIVILLLPPRLLALL